MYLICLQLVRTLHHFGLQLACLVACKIAPRIFACMYDRNHYGCICLSPASAAAVSMSRVSLEEACALVCFGPSLLAWLLPQLPLTAKLSKECFATLPPAAAQPTRVAQATHDNCQHAC
jgi:hypothetical protein